ncbi:spore coat putative kinase YutH [Evansella halocellulosilytica]|uniref:spore coat putative kinase YutH n=1 Tax=Evansella halocellulosilytica TaxID=2011013 RepID=UPI0015CB2BCD|nr:spore coat protein YutH [Evansella halocellulosilytica]
MLDRQLFDHFRIYLDDVLYVGDDLVVLANGDEYLVRTIDERNMNQLDEQINMANWLRYYGERGLAQYVKPEGDRKAISHDGGEAVLFSIEKPHFQDINTFNVDKIGTRLAKFHEKGMTYSPQYTKNTEMTFGISAWKLKWERRLDQLEKWYVRMRQERMKTDLDEQFLISFPYYLGLCENAIQMTADLLIDEPVLSAGGNTICHHRFRENTWLTVHEHELSSLKVPTDFLYDHYTRDITEYVRSYWMNEEESNQLHIINEFLNDYEAYHPLSLFDQKLLLARCMFPTHYFEQIEAYYQTVYSEERASMRQNCMNLFDRSADYEKLFLYLTTRYPHLQKTNHCPLWFQTPSIKHSSYV